MATGWTQAEYDALKAAVAQGVLRVEYQDRTVVYQDLKAMRDLLAEMAQSLAVATGNYSNRRYMATSKGC